VIVAQPHPERLRFTKQKFRVENQVAEKVVYHRIAFFFIRLIAAEQQHVVVLCIRIVVSDVPVMQVVRDDTQAERQMPEPLAESQLNIERQVLPLTIVGSELSACIPQHQPHGEPAGGIGVEQPSVSDQR